MRRILLLALLMLALPLGAASAETAVGVALSPRDKSDLQRIETYLDHIRTLHAGFEQTNPNGDTVDGDVYMARPGRMRFQYAPPTRLVIISDGNYVSVDDQEMNQVTFYPVDATPIWFLLREGIKLSGDVTVTRFERQPGSLRVTAAQTAHPDNGAITLVFSDKPLQLVKWIILDPQQQSTSVALMDQQAGGALDPSLFVLPKNAQMRNSGKH